MGAWEFIQNQILGLKWLNVLIGILIIALVVLIVIRLRLKRRLDSIKRIHEATDTLEERIGELEHSEADLLAQIQSLETLAQGVQSLLAQTVGRRHLRNAA